MRHAPTPLARALRRLLPLGAGLALGLCLAIPPAAGAAERAPAKATPAKPAASAKAPVKATAKARAKAKAKAKKAEPPRLPFVEGDYERALADARARNVPLVADVWAPW